MQTVPVPSQYDAEKPPDERHLKGLFTQNSICTINQKGDCKSGLTLRGSLTPLSAARRDAPSGARSHSLMN